MFSNLEQGTSAQNARQLVDESRITFPVYLALSVVLLSIGLLYVLLFAACVNLSGKVIEISIAGFQLILVSATVCKILLAAQPSPHRKIWFLPLMVWTVTSSTMASALFIALGFFVHLSGRSLNFWQTYAWRILAFICISHALGALTLARCASLRSLLALLDLEKCLSIALILLFCSMALNFHVELTNPWFNPLLQFVFAPTFQQAQTSGILSAILTLAIVLLVAHCEKAPFLASYPASAYGQKALLLIVIAAASIFYFDFRLPADPMHYLTNAGPALRLLHGGFPLVDTFSQYGPGPMIATAVGFQFLPATLGTASLLVQCFNLLFFVVLLVCLSRLTSARVASTILGAAIISVLLGCWGSGYSNLSGAPSNMGFRYLWPAVMVLAIGSLPWSRTWSSGTAGASAISSVWSVEALAASLMIHLSFTVVVRFVQRKPYQLVMELPIIILPAILTLSAFSVLVGIYSGRLPDFQTYLRFLSVYNAFSDYWAIPAVSTFWGWIPILILLSLVASLVWKIIFARTLGLGGKVDRDILRGYFPMAALGAFITLYYLGRSVDNVLLLALLPLSFVVVAPYLSLIDNWRDWSPLGWTGFGLISLAIFWGLACGYIYLYRQNSPYHMAFHECRYGGRCSSSALISTLRASIEKEDPAIGTISYIGSDGERMIDEAVSLIRANFKDDRASVILGTFHGRSLATDLALLRAGKSSLWPISYTFTDELIPQLAEKIAAATVDLKSGDQVIVRRDETALGPLELEILRRLRLRVKLCVREVHFFTIVYIVSQNRECNYN